MKNGLMLISDERHRQILKKGWTQEHDNEHTHCEMASAALSYIRFAHTTSRQPIPGCWPWDTKWWKPSDDPIRNLTKAGALIAAEIDRLQRLKA